MQLDIILVEPKIGGNIGAIARLCENFKVNRLVLIAPPIDHNNDESRQRAKHSIHYLENDRGPGTFLWEYYHDEIRKHFYSPD